MHNKVMKRALIDNNKCKNCKECKIDKNCDMNVIIREDKNEKPWIDFYKCCGCFKCKSFCKNNAVIMIN
jgi:MinD superfamily P-loop ATPase